MKTKLFVAKGIALMLLAVGVTTVYAEVPLPGRLTHKSVI